MVKRSFWLNKIEEAWKRRPIVWLNGVRRAGKTFLCKGLETVEYFDCERPVVRRQMDDVEAFLSKRHGRIVLDEVHRLDNPAELLKVAADHFPDLKIVATGSSSLEVSSKFSDALTGRKEEVLLTPMMSDDIHAFGNDDLSHRFLNGGLPPFFISRDLSEKDYQEWVDSYWAKDIQALFRLERHFAFQKFVELLFTNSGSIFEATRYARPCEVSRTTISNYIAVLEHTSAVYIIRPFSSHGTTEITAASKVYAFDTGFVCFYNGWRELRPEDLGRLWEHYVLNEMIARTQTKDILYWRDKQGHEIDFVFRKARGTPPVTIECKWSDSQFKPDNLKIFRARYPDGENWVVSPTVKTSYSVKIKGLLIEFLSFDDFVRRLEHPVN